MFNNNSPKKNPKMNSSNSKNLPSVNMISEGTAVKGTLNTKNDIRIAGEVEGEARADGKLIITSSGKIQGDVHAVDGDIAGNLQGEIRVSNKLIVRQSAVIDGDIYTKSLLVEEGAKINGACKMNETVEPPKKITRQKADSENNKSPEPKKVE